jgi:hypothetical protein
MTTSPKAHGSYREYEMTSEHGNGSIAFTLGDLNADTMPARFAKHVGAEAFGLVSILGFPEAPVRPVIWVLVNQKLGITVADEDRDLTDALKLIVARYIAVFFNDIADIAPELATIRLRTDGRGDRSLN